MKRLLTLLMALCMLLAMIPFGAMAAEATVTASETKLKLGSNALTMDSGYDYTAFEFEPTETGVYTFTANKTNAVVEYWGGNPYFMFKQTENGTNKLELQIKSVGPSYMIGISGVSSCTLTVAKTGEIQNEATIETVNYVNTHTPSTGYNPLTGSETMNYVDVTKAHSAVKGSDGYYHLDSATGAILYVDFTGPANEFNWTTSGLGGALWMRMTVYENGVAVKKYEILDALRAYSACVDSSDLYPLTDDLMMFLKHYGANNGWYNPDLTPFLTVEKGGYNEDSVWMIACCYDKNYVDSGAGNPGSGNTPGGEGGNEEVTPPVEDDGSLGSPSNPIWLNAPSDTISIPAGKTQYYTGRFGDMIMTINGSKVKVVHNGTTYTASNGKVTLECVQTSMWEPCLFAITNTGASAINYSVSVAYPLGYMDNPATLVMGSNSAPCKKDGNGYFYTWTAPKDGTLTITMTSSNWMYTMNNMTQALYGEQQYSDSKPVVNPGTISVSAGDVIEVQVNTYNPDAPYSAPAGNVIFTAQFKEAAPKFDIAFANMSLNNSLAMNFAFEQADVPNAAGCYAVITQKFANDKEDKIVTIPSSKWGAAGINGVAHYTLKFDGVAAKEMSDSIYVCIYDANGNALSNVWEDSVRGYAMRTLNNPKTSQKSMTMIVDLLNYGAAAQTKFKYNTSDLANNQMTAAQKAMATPSAAASDNRVKGSNYLGTNLSLESQILLNMAFQGVTSNMYATISFTNHNNKQVTVRVEASEMEIANGVAKIAIDDIVIADARRLVTVTIYNANGTVYSRASDSVEGYIARMRQKEPDPLYEMILKFGDSAYAYFH